MKEFELTLRLRNNLLKRRRVELGLSTTQFAEAAGVSYGVYMQYEGLRRDPRTKAGEWCETALRLSAFHGLSPEELWPPTVLAVQKHTLVTELEGVEALALGGYTQTMELPPTPEELLLLQEKSQVVQEAMKELRPREHRALQLKFIEEKTYEQAGEIFYEEDGSYGITGTTVQRVAQEGLWKLREARGWGETPGLVKQRKRLKEIL